MIDPRISLGIQMPTTQSPQTAINIFENTLMNAQNRETAQQQNAIAAAQEQRRAQLAPFQQQQAQQNVDINAQTLASNEQLQKLQNKHQVGQMVKERIARGDIQGTLDFLMQSRAKAKTQGITSTGEIDSWINDLQSGNVDRVLGDINAVEGLVTGGKSQQQAPPASVQETQWFNAQTPDVQAAHLKVKRGEQLSRPEQLEHEQALANIDIATTQKKEVIKKTVQRTSDIKKEFSERRRLAARSTRKVKEAQKLAQKATQGIAGQGKLALSRLFPGIDASDEGALSSAFKGLALDELQKFKGPTTDFEFAVTEDIAGSLGSSASANIARLASLERASWFADRESKQFNDHAKAGHDPDGFFFNFDELVTPKKGGKSYSLQSLQDTAVANHISIDEVIKRLSR